jgi:hypothetical protein
MGWLRNADSANSGVNTNTFDKGIWNHNVVHNPIGPSVPGTYTYPTVQQDPRIAQLEGRIVTMQTDLLYLTQQKKSMEKIIQEQQEKIDRLMRAVFPTF